jgi:hypothetical protein
MTKVANIPRTSFVFMPSPLPLGLIMIFHRGSHA